MAAPRTPRVDPGASPEVISWIRRILDPLRDYHGYRVEGLEHVPREGAAILAASHSLATYDGFLLGLAIYDAIGRLPAGLGDDLIFRIPGLGALAMRANLHPANPHNGLRLLAQGHILGLAPGGMRESLRPSSERYRVRWERRKGFVRLSIRSGAPIILAATPAADDIYDVRESDLTKLAYKRLKVPVPIARGVGPTLVPRPVSLTTWLSEPIHPPAHDPEHEAAQVDAHHAQVLARMEALMAAGAPDRDRAYR